MPVAGAGEGSVSVERGRCWAHRLLYLPAVPGPRFLTFKCHPGRQTFWRHDLLRLSAKASCRY
jgi:hypothetical protein